MKKTIAAIFALGALATAAAPAMAQPYGGPDHRGGMDRGGMDRRDDGGWGDLRGRVDAVLAKADRALHSDRLTRSERSSISYRSNKLATLEHRYERGGLNPRERADINAQVDDLNGRIDRMQWENRGGPRGDDHHGDRH